MKKRKDFLKELKHTIEQRTKELRTLYKETKKEILDDSEKEEFILKKSENDIKQYIINNDNVNDTNVNVLASAIVEVKDDMNSNTYIVNTIVYIEYVNEQRRQYTKYCVKYIEDKNDSNTETSKRCRGCGSEMQGNKCKYCGLTANENEVELTTVEIYKIK